MRPRQLIISWWEFCGKDRLTNFPLGGVDVGVWSGEERGKLLQPVICPNPGWPGACQLMRHCTPVWLRGPYGGQKLTMVPVWSGCGCDDVVLPTHTGNKVSSCVAEQPWRSVCIFGGLEEAVYFNWDWSGGDPVTSQHLIENGGPWGTGWCCLGRGLVPPFWLGLRSIEKIKWILPALAATPLRHGQLKGYGDTTCTYDFDVV